VSAYVAYGVGDCPGPAECDGFERISGATPMLSPVPAWAKRPEADAAMLEARTVSRAQVIAEAGRLGIPTGAALDWYVNGGRERRLCYYERGIR